MTYTGTLAPGKHLVIPLVMKNDVVQRPSRVGGLALAAEFSRTLLEIFMNFFATMKVNED